MNIAAFHASARFGLGARNSELQEIGSDPRGWLMAQIAKPAIPSEVLKHHIRAGLQDTALKKLKKSKSGNEAAIDKRKIYINETGARIVAQSRSRQPFIERMVLFWSNHFTVSIQKGIISGLVNQYEVEAIRPHISGYFKDMLLAVSRHPAMLLYLDNTKSTGIHSPLGRKRHKGLNENLAREILELHTLGVSGGYTQEDVIALAKIITGWTLDKGPDGPILNFKFEPAMHEPGNKVLLGRRFQENGEQEGIAALTMLAEQPSTARHIATKLARHFIADDPSPRSVETLAKAFQSSGGYLPAVMRTLINLDEAWQKPLAKMKNPYEYAISAFRLTGIEPKPQQALQSMEALNFRVFGASSPAGFDDISAAWAAPDAIMKRIEWAHQLAQRLPTGNPMQLAQAGLGAALSTPTRQAIERAPSSIEGISLLLASPEFLRR